MSGNQLALATIIVIAVLSLLFAFLISRKRDLRKDP
jgi:hypothetical protein